MNIIELLDDSSVDVCLTDPPYGIEFQSAWRTDRNMWKPKIDNDGSPFIDWIEPLYAKMKDGGRLLCFYRWDVQDEFLNEIERVGFTVKSQIVWDKCIHGMGDLKGEFSPQHELIIYATKGRYEFKGKRPSSVYRIQRVHPEKLVHPNEKPVELIRSLLLAISEEGELVFDPFGGSFSTYLAATQLGRKALSCELSEHYYDIGVERLGQVDSDYF